MRNLLKMIATSISAWDLGITFGIDDQVFDQKLIDLLQSSLGPDIGIRKADTPHSSMSPAIGSGLRLDLKKTDLPDIISGFAFEYNKSTKVKETISAMVVVDLFLDIFSLGIAYIQMDIRYPAGTNPKIIEEVGIALEEGTLTRGSDFLNRIGQKIVQALSSLGRADNSTVRTDLQSVPKGYFFPGFSDVLLPEEGDDRARLEEYIRNYNSELTIIDTDDGILFYGWAISALFPQVDTDYAKIIGILKYAMVFNEATIAYEKLFTEKLHSVWRGMLNETNIEAPDLAILQRLRTLASAIIGVTRFSTMTQDEDNLSVFKAFNKMASIESRHERIREASEVFHLIEAEFLRAKEERRQKQLNTVIFFLTALTFITVLADILTTVDYSNSLFPSYISRFAILLSLPALAIIIVWFRIFHRDR